MKIRRTMTRREFYVRTAGWFTVLKPDTRFPALRLRSGFRDLDSPSGRRLQWVTLTAAKRPIRCGS